jgi:hypothetical protein
MTHTPAANERPSAPRTRTQVTRLILPLILLLLLVLAGQSRLIAATYYVAQNGIDAANCGTTKGSNECASIEYALTGRAKQTRPSISGTRSSWNAARPALPLPAPMTRRISGNQGAATI